MISFRSNAQTLSKKIDSLDCQKSVMTSLSNSKNISFENYKPIKKNSFNFNLGKEKEVIYRDNFTNRLYFQNAFDRTRVNQK